MKKLDSYIVGTMQINDKAFAVEIIGDILVVKTDLVLNKEQRAVIVNHVVSVKTKGKGSPMLYLYIDKRANAYYSAETFHILLLYREYEKTNNIQFEIISKGLTNAVNSDRKSGKDPLYKIKHNLGKNFLKTTTTFDNCEYDVCFCNMAIQNDNNLCPAEFTSALILRPKDGVFFNKLFSVFNFAIQFIQFVSLNTYPIIDHFIVRNDSDGFSEIEIYKDFDEYDSKNDRYLSIVSFHQYIDRFINCFPDIIPYRHNAFHYKREWIYEFDIVRMSGMFEWVFRELLEKSETYKNSLKKRKKKIHYNELSATIKAFSKKYNLGENEDFAFCKQMFDTYGGTLKNKLDFVLTDFCKSMDLIIIDNSFFYSPAKFETRLKDARNVICHGLYKKKIDWKNAANDTIILQELIYFMLLKYKAKLPRGKIRDCLDTSFGYINKSSSLYKKNDPRIKWVD